MSEISVNLLASNVPVNGLVAAPEITIQRLDTGAEVQADQAMTDQGTRGLYTFTFAAVNGLRYSFLIDADPLASGQVDVRYWRGAFDLDDEQSREMLESDEVYDDTGKLLHRYRRGGVVDLIPAKNVVGTIVGNDTSLKE